MAMTRGGEANTAHVATQTVSDPDAATGEVHDAIHRDPRSLLALAFEHDQPQLSALAIQAESAAEARSVRTAIELLAERTAELGSSRCATWLDQLVDQGHLTPGQRRRIAAEDGAATLARVLRRAELAGHDPARVLRDAVIEQDFHGARRLTNILYARITGNRNLSLDPVGDTYTQRVAHVTNPADQHYLASLAIAADTRRHELATEALNDSPGWVLEAFGPPPTDPQERDTWAERVGIVAAHRELSEFTDPTTALGPPPKPGQPEHHASWRAACRALGLPEADTEEMHMSEGQLRMRIRAWDREKAWAPDNVTHELAGTRQAATRHRNKSTVLAAHASAATDPDTRNRLQQEAAETAALADLLDTQITHLAETDDIYSYYLVETAHTRAGAHRAELELANRHATTPPPDDTTSAEEWLTTEDAARRADDAYRDIAEHDLTALDQADLNTVTDTTAQEPMVETAVPDIRELAATQAPRPIDDSVHVPTLEHTTDSLARARAALNETQQRQALEAHHAAEYAHSQQLARWQTEDQAAEHRETIDQATTAREPVGLHE
jgi:hypothetical protein